MIWKITLSALGAIGYLYLLGRIELLERRLDAQKDRSITLDDVRDAKGRAHVFSATKAGGPSINAQAKVAVGLQ